ncbi:pectin lyase fold/virulence factor [Choanephora cucurbitarum]|nr:pectin lyase fold/virulence factor [Choanephora cucurbitarum]
MKYSFGILLTFLVHATLALAASVDVCSSCKYKTISAALASLPSGSTSYTINIAPGTYTERLNIQRSNVVLAKKGSGTVLVQYAIAHNTQDPKSNASQKAVVTVAGSNVRFYDITIANIYKQARDMATVALFVSGKQVSFYRSNIYGFQDTLLINENATAYFKSCYIEGSVDFIYGYGTGYFQSCTIGSNAAGYITAHYRRSSSASGGLYFNSCTTKVTVPSGPISKTANPSLSFTSSSKTTHTSYLGRPWSQYARVVFIYSDIGAHINPAGWSTWSPNDPRTSNVFFAEYGNKGSSGSINNRKFVTKLSQSQASQYSAGGVFGSTSWIDTNA